jgi:hypothetical protein
MSAVARGYCLVVILIAGSIAGCSSDASNPTAAAAKTDAPAAPPAPLLKPDVPQTPDAAVQKVLEGLRASKPVVLWEALPESAQHSLDSLIANSASKVDKEVWAQTVANLKKLVTLLETKKEFILASPMWKTGQLPKLDDIKASWDPAVKVLRTAVDSDLTDQQKMSDFHGQAFFDGTGAKVFADVRALTKTLKPDPLAIIDTAKVTVTKQSDTSAKLTITSPDPKSKPIEVNLAIVDGKWTSPQLNLISQFGGLAVIGYLEPFRPYQLVEWKQDYMKDMDRLGKILDKLQGATTNKEFQTAVANQLLPFAIQKVTQVRAKRPKRTQIEALSYERQANTAMVVVKGLHSFDEPTYHDLTKAIRAISPEMFRGPMEAEGSTLFFVGPVDGAFQKTLEAIKVGKIAGQDKLRDTVTVELATSLKDEKTTAEAAKSN